MSCPNCDNSNYELGTPCSNCDYYEKPQYWDMGFCAIRIEPKNWAVCYNGHPVEREFASYRDAHDAAYTWDEEMSLEVANMNH